jgi:alpha-beta hydrolase superfamily lysophospholipase
MPSNRIEPLYFGPRGGRCFGFIHLPSGRDVARTRATGVVIVDAVGYETLSAHRSLRHLAERLARAGFPVLRYDHAGEGDADGGARAEGRLRTWIDGVGAAMDELKARAGVAEVALFGLRLGGTLATVAAAERGDAASLVLFAPCSTGRAYVREIRAFRLIKQRDDGFEVRPSRGARAGDEEAAGFLLDAELVADLGKLSALTLPRAPAPRALVLGRDDIPSEGPLVKALTAAGVAVDHRETPGYAAMMQDAHAAVVPEALFEEVTAWLEAAHPAMRPALAEAPETSETSETSAPPGGNGTRGTRERAEDAESTTAEGPVLELADGARERPLSFDEGRLFGILTEPAPPLVAATASGTRAAAPARTCVIFTNPGAVHRIGNNRMYVTLARAFAARGIAALRLDLGGLGDSLPAPGQRENNVYAPTVAADVQAAMRALKARGVERFILVGLCSGAFAAYHAALRGGPVAACVLLNPQSFYWRDGDSLTVTPAQVAGQAAHYQRALFQRDSWAKVLRGEVDLQKFAGIIARRARGIASGKLAEIRRAVGLHAAPGEGDVAVDLRAIVTSGVEVLIVFSAGDPGIAYLTMRAGRAIERLRARPGFEIGTIEGADHTFTPLWSQEALEDLLVPRLAARFGSPPRAPAPPEHPDAAARAGAPDPVIVRT